MKRTRKLIPALAMLLMSAVLMSTASYAWFSMNTTVSASGMQVKATATGSLLISTSHGGNYAVNTTFSDTVKTLAPCTYLAENAAGQSSTAGYYYVSNPAAVDPITGLAITGQTLNYAAATEWQAGSGSNAESGHYHDYVVYLKAEGAEVSFTNLTATVTFTDNLSAGQLATTVDFFVNTTAVTGDYTGYTVNHTKTVAADDTVKSVGLGALTIANDAVYAIVMRVYVDGAATSASNTGTAYVNSTNGDVSNVSISVEFSEGSSST